MSFFGKHQPINALSNFDIELQYFYNYLLSTILKNEKLKKTVLESLGQDRIRHIQKIDSKVSLQNTAYIFRYGPCYTSAVANYMLRLVKDNPFIFRDALWKRSVNICSFGGASVFEIVAICKIFSLAQDLFWESTRKPLQINMTIVGIGNNRQWKKASSHVLQVLSKTHTFLDTSKMVITVQHVKANPDKLLNSSIVKVLKDSDIVTMVKFISTHRVGTIMEQFIWEVSDNMKMNSVLFFLDTGMVQQCKQLQKVLEPLKEFKNIFGPKNIEPFTLSIKSIQKCVELFWARLQGNICLTSCIVNTCAWVKSEPIPIQNEPGHKTPLKLSRKARQEKVKKNKQEWCENVLKSQKALEDYHRQVRHIIPKINSRKEGNLEDDSCFFLDYPKHKDNVLFKSKSKNRRIYLDERADFSVA